MHNPSQQVGVGQMVVFFKYFNNVIVLVDMHLCHNELSGKTFHESPKNSQNP